MKVETVGETLQRLARESLPRKFTKGNGRHGKKLCYECGEFLPAFPKTRNRHLVCDDCAIAIPRLIGGRSPEHVCAGCGETFSRVRLKMKDRRLYCKKCLKIKFQIDF